MHLRTNRTWLLIALGLSIALLSVHLHALDQFLYWHHRWLDIPMHMLGGAAAGAFLMAFGTGRRTFTYFLCMMAIFVGWEVFEYAARISTGQPDYWLDTSKDIVDGLIGSAATFLIARKTTWR